MNLDWRRLKAVVLESDDWGLCAWSPDEQAHRVLADLPAFRSPSGQRYGRSTLESAADVRALRELLLEFRGRDGFPPVWQANTVMAAPDYARIEPSRVTTDALPLLAAPDLPERWRRPGLWSEIDSAVAAGVWWPELHGLHHLPAHAWVAALKAGEDDALRAHQHQSPICRAVEASGEYAGAEPLEARRRDLATAVELFTRRFGRAPTSFCPPDYQWDEGLDADADRHALTLFQGHAERAGPWLRLRRLFHRHRWPLREGGRFSMPPRIAFEPRGAADPAQLGVGTTLRSVRAAWGRGQPAVVSSHRLNYAHLDAGWSAAGRAALRELLGALAADGAFFLVDAEVRALVERGWSVRTIGGDGAVLRFHGEPRGAVLVPLPPGARGVTFAGGGSGEQTLEGNGVRVNVEAGDYRLEWRST